MTSLPLTPPPETNNQAPWKVLVVGAAYGGLNAIVNLLEYADGNPGRPHHLTLPDFKGARPKRGLEVVALDERDGFFHSVGAPLAHVAKHSTASSWKQFSQLRELQHPALELVRGSIRHVDCEARSATYFCSESKEERSIFYNYLILATGLKRAWPVVPRVDLKDDYVEDAFGFINAIERSANGRAVVVGGGAVGIEFAAEIALNHPSLHVILVHSRTQLLSSEPLPGEFKARALDVLREEGVEVILGQRAHIEKAVDGTSKVTLTDGSVIEVGAVFDGRSGVVPVTQCLPSEALDEHGYVKILPNLTLPTTVPNASSHLCIGDICAWSGIKRAGNALSMGHLAAANIFASILSTEATNLQHTKDHSFALHDMGAALPTPGSESPSYTPASVEATEDAPSPSSEDQSVDAMPPTALPTETNTQLPPLFPQTEFPEIPAVMGLAVGTQCVTWDGKEVKWGKEIMEQSFGSDLGWANTLKYMKLTGLEDE